MIQPILHKVTDIFKLKVQASIRFAGKHNSGLDL